MTNGSNPLKVAHFPLSSGSSQKTYILAPDVLMKYPGIIPGNNEPSDPYSASIVPEKGDPLYDARLIIPEITLDALDNAAGDLTNAGRNSACALRRIMRIIEAEQHTLKQTLSLEAFCVTKRDACKLAILPLAEEFVDGIPCGPATESDIDGIVAITAFEAIAIASGRFKDGIFDEVDDLGESFFKLSKSLSAGKDDYILVTNRPLTVAKARALGVETMSYNIPEPLPHTGIRYYVVPNSLYDQFQVEHKIDLADWQATFPNDAPLLQNEYLVMYPLRLVTQFTPPTGLTEWKPTRLPQDSEVVTANPTETYGYEYVGTVKRPAGTVIHLKNIGSSEARAMIPFNNPEYAAYIDALHDPEIDTVIVTGPAGTGKTYGAFNTALDDCVGGTYVHTIVVKDGKHALGAVPGDVEQKMAPMVGFGKDAIGARYSESEEVQKLRTKEQKGDNNGACAHKHIQENIEMKWSKNFTSVPYEDAQGRSFPNMFVILDEFQRVNINTADTLLTRAGKKSKRVVLGDVNQIYDATEVSRAVNGLVYARELFLGESCAALIHLIRGLRSDSTATIIKNRAAVRARLGVKD